jgi:hypothetical protein
MFPPSQLSFENFAPDNVIFRYQNPHYRNILADKAGSSEKQPGAEVGTSVRA